MLKVMIVDNESAIRKGLVHCIHWGDLCALCAEVIYFFGQTRLEKNQPP